MTSRRDFLKLSIAAAIASGAPWYNFIRRAYAIPQAAGLSDPAIQPLFTEPVPNAMSANFKYTPKNNKLGIIVGQTVQQTGLLDINGTRLSTTVWGYGENGVGGVTWPGRTIERHINDEPLEILWQNKLLDSVTSAPLPHLLPVDSSCHWAYGIDVANSANGNDYTQYSIATHGVPLIMHVHGGKNDSYFDGNPEYFFSPGWGVRGPRWVEKKFKYGGDNWNECAGMLWYHDHALGITRLNVYAGLAGFFPLRDDYDTGKPDNPLGLPADPYELGYAVQDRMFKDNGDLFYPAYPGDPFYYGFIDEEGAFLPPDLFPGGGPTTLAEFFGDHIVVNGKIWPKASVEPRQYRVRLLNGCDSRFMRLRLKVVSVTETDPTDGDLIPFLVIGSDQGLRDTPKVVTEVDFLPGERLDLIFDFTASVGSRVIIENILGDAPFNGELPSADDLFINRRTNRIIAFDVELPFNSTRPDTSIGESTQLLCGLMNSNKAKHNASLVPPTVRKLALFEGRDEFGRLQPLLGTAEPCVDVNGNLVSGTCTFSQPITENPGLGDTEIWEIYNATEDAHPIHVHLVHFTVINREGFSADVIAQPLMHANGILGTGARLENIITDGNVQEPNPAEQTPRDMVISLPGQVTRIQMTFDKPGRFVWHCHILSHEDHEMMRPFYVGEVG